MARVLIPLLLFLFQLPAARAQTPVSKANPWLFRGDNPLAPSPSYRVRWDAAVREPRSDSPERDCGFGLNVAVLESADTIGARVQAINRTDRLLDIRIRPGELLARFLGEDDDQDFHGVMPPQQAFSLLWGFASPKEEVLDEHVLEFFVEAKEIAPDGQPGEWQCRRRAEILRVREGKVYSHDPFFMGAQLGTTFLRSGPLAELGSKNGFAWGIDMGIYGESWGGVFALDFHDHGGGGAEIQGRMRAAFPAWAEPSIRSYDLGLLASRRFRLRDAWIGFYDLGLGMTVFQYGDDRDDRLSESRYLAGLQQRATLLYRVRRYRLHPFDKGAVHVGFTLNHQYVPSGEVLGLAVDGHSLTGLFQLKFSH